MKNLLALLSLALLVFATVGYFRGWYKFESAANDDGGRTFNVDVNGSRINHDFQQGKDQLRRFLISEDGKQATPPQQANVQPQPPQGAVQTRDGTIVFPGATQPQQAPQQTGWWPSHPPAQQQQPPQPSQPQSHSWWPTVTMRAPQQPQVQNQPQQPQQRPGFFQVQLPQVKLPQIQLPHVNLPQPPQPPQQVQQSQWWPVNPQR